MEWTSNCWRPQLNARGQVGGNGVVQVWKMSTIEWIREWHSVSAGNRQTPLPLFHYSTFPQIDWLIDGHSQWLSSSPSFLFQISSILDDTMSASASSNIKQNLLLWLFTRFLPHFSAKMDRFTHTSHTTHSHILKYLYICRGTQMIIDNRQSTMNLCCSPKGHLQD